MVSVPRHSRSDAQTLATVLIALRKQRGLSQEKFAAQSQVDRAYVGGIERGKRKPSFFVIEKLLAGLDVTWAEFGAALDREAKRQLARS
jgi:transcriptional regulator with XRE-family HTH domain